MNRSAMASLFRANLRLRVRDEQVGDGEFVPGESVFASSR